MPAICARADTFAARGRSYAIKRVPLRQAGCATKAIRAVVLHGPDGLQMMTATAR